MALVLAGLLAPLARVAPPSVAPSAAPSVAPLPGKVFLTVEEALDLAFPDCTVETRNHVLTRPEQERVEELAGVPPEGAVVRSYRATHQDVLVGTAYVEAHTVRTMREVLLVVVSPDHTLRRIEVLAFAEPLEYLPRESWYAQFEGRPLDDELSLKRAIRGVAGATLTARATTDAARRALAIHRVLAGQPGAPRR